MLTFDPPIHPGEILREEFLTPLDLSAGALAKALGVPRTRIERIVKGQMGISADTALRLAKYFDTTPNVWLNLQWRSSRSRPDRRKPSQHEFCPLGQNLRSPLLPSVYLQDCIPSQRAGLSGRHVPLPDATQGD